MARVCCEMFPKGTWKDQRKEGLYMDDLLKNQIDILIKNIKNDWDFTILITGGGEVRVGKSKLASDIGTYWTEQMYKVHGIRVPFDVKTNFVLEGKKLIKAGNDLGVNHPYSCLIFDEAGADLEGRKIMTQMTQDVLDYYRECGQYNMLNILVLPEFFDLPKGIALSRSICLIDVYYTTDDDDIFKRGYFNFYSRRNKKYLYIKGKKDANYQAGKYNFHGRFSNFWTINKKEYEELKMESMLKRESRRRNKFQLQRDACWYLLNKEFNKAQSWIGKRMEQLTGIFVPQQTISDGLKHYTMENE